MTREIDPQAIEDETLTWEEYEYLRVRGRLPDDYPEMEPPEDDGDDEQAEYLPSKVVPLDEQTVPLMEEDDEDKAEYKPSKSTPLEEQSVPVMGNKGGIVEEDGELEGVGSDYSNEEGWNNDKRRAELAKRGLVVSGNKEEMIGRLRRYDADELYEDDLEAEAEETE